MARPYENKLAIVTGGSRGIGEAVVRALAAKGANLLVAYTSPSSEALSKQLCSELSDAHQIHVVAVQADLADPGPAAEKILAGARELFASYKSKTGHDFQIDILVNNAGVASNQFMNDGSQGPITAEEFHRVYTVNVLAPLLVTQAIAPHLPTDRSGRIVSVSSVSSSIGYEGQSVYAGSKAAVEAMTRTWSRELAGRATVNAVNPGPVWSDMYEKVGESFWKINQPYLDATPLAEYNGERALVEKNGHEVHKFEQIITHHMRGRRPGFTSEVAGTVDMLCSPEAGWTTGSVVCANGGMKMTFA